MDPEKWVEKHGDYLFSYARTRLGGEELARDLVQESFLSALRARDKFRGDSTERTWLTSILRHKILDHYRLMARRDEDPVPSGGPYFDDMFFRGEDDPFRGKWIQGRGPHSHSLLPEGKMEEEELGEFIRYCLDNLPERLAAVFIMRLIDEEESEKICKELDISASNYWVLLHRAKLRMRACLENTWLEKKDERIDA